MIRQFELVERVREYNPNTNEALLNRAYVFGARAHANQKRASGEPYFTGHPLEVAAILTNLELDDASIVTALLHDTIEDTTVTRKDIANAFGDEIAELVDGVTKLTQFELTSKETAQAENFRKLLLAVAKDVRVILVKLADRLHNMRTIGALRSDKRQRIARETMEIYAPLAGRMGMQSIREQLEDLAFEVINPEARTSIMRRFVKLRRATGDMIPKISADICAALADAGIQAEVQGREKRPYSVWHKMEEKNVGFSQLSDIYGFRVICQNDEDCYRALGAIHRKWRAVPGRFKDYISSPKANGYRSLHTTTVGAGAMRVEMQIRTWEMHAVAETGVAAHWAYKDGMPAENPFAVDPFSWLRGFVARLEKGDEPQAFLEHVKLDMFTDKVFCFTPKGDLIGLPRGATPIDFAYAIHTKIGNHCAGALVDGRRVPLWERLRNGQQVEIITAVGQAPSAHWEDIAQTGRAKAAIRRALRLHTQAEQAALGRDLLDHAFLRAGREAGNRAYKVAAQQLNFADAEEMLVALAKGTITTHKILRALYPSQPDDDGTLGAEVEICGALHHQRVRGVRGSHPLRFCTCCWPVPGDRIVGVSVHGWVVVHMISCPLLEAYENELDRWHDITWDPEAAALCNNIARIEMTIANQPGTLGQVCSLIGEQRANIENITISSRKPDFFVMQVDIEVRDICHLGDIMTAVRAQSFVSSIERSIARPKDMENPSGES